MRVYFFVAMWLVCGYFVAEIYWTVLFHEDIEKSMVSSLSLTRCGCNGDIMLITLRHFYNTNECIFLLSLSNSDYFSIF